MLILQFAMLDLGSIRPSLLAPQAQRRPIWAHAHVGSMGPWAHGPWAHGPGPVSTCSRAAMRPWRLACCRGVLSKQLEQEITKDRVVLLGSFFDNLLDS